MGAAGAAAEAGGMRRRGGRIRASNPHTSGSIGHLCGPRRRSSDASRGPPAPPTLPQPPRASPNSSTGAFCPAATAAAATAGKKVGSELVRGAAH